MKKCPTCEKTFDDNMKFCQSDGTPLEVVPEETPSTDPYKTMVASGISVPPAEPNEESSGSAEPPAEPPADPVAGDDRKPSEAETKEAVDTSGVLEIPESGEPADPLKTVVVTGSETSGDLVVPEMPKVEPPETEPAAFEEPEPETDISDSEAETVVAPQIPKFSEPDLDPPELFPVGKQEEVHGVEPTESPEKPDSEPSVPIPSPFEQSMPPGFAPPSDPPFSKESIPVPESEPEPIVESSTPPPSPFAEASESASGSGVNEPVSDPAALPIAVSAAAPDPFASNSIVSAPSDSSAGTEGENKTLAIVSLVSGIVSVLCCFLGIVVGPAAVITGYMARSKIGQDPAQYGGGTMAMIGMILGAIGFFLFVIWFVLQVLGSLPALMNSF